MAKLNSEEIQFIDNYLENSDIIYADIRMEMTDHVASEIENNLEANKNTSFYDAFKAYMVKNKAELLKENKRFVNSVVNQNTKLILKELIKLKTILLFVTLVFFTNFLLADLNTKATMNLFSIPLILMIATTIIYFIGTIIYNYSRFSGVERLGIMYYVLYNIIYFIYTITKNRIEAGINTIYVSITLVLSVVLIYVFIKVAIQVIKSYLSNYKSIA